MVRSVVVRCGVIVKMSAAVSFSQLHNDNEPCQHPTDLWRLHTPALI